MTSTPDVLEVAGFLAPMPGGVGPMTRAMLLTNVVEAPSGPSSRPRADRVGVGEVSGGEWPLSAGPAEGISVGLSVSAVGRLPPGLTVLLVGLGRLRRPGCGPSCPASGSACSGPRHGVSTSPRSCFFGLGLSVLALVVPLAVVITRRRAGRLTDRLGPVVPQPG